MDENPHGEDSTKTIISPPVKPVKKKLLKTLSKVLSDIEPIREAHLPLVLENRVESAAGTRFIRGSCPSLEDPRRDGHDQHPV